MQISKLAAIENKPGKFTVSFTDGTDIIVSAAQIADFGLYSGLELPENEYGKLVNDLKLGSARARAIRILGSRNLSSHEIGKRLVSKGESAGIAQETVKWLEDIGAINDPEYAGQIVRHYSAKGFGLARIRDELFRRGIPRELWDEALTFLERPEDSETAEDAVQIFLDRKLRGSTDKDELRRAADALCRRGFSYEDAKSAVNRYVLRVSAENAEE